MVAVAERFGLNGEDFITACYLHDTLEDTRRSYSDLKDRFGERVAEMVYAVTNERGRNRKERNEKTYPKIRGVYDATCLKLADRIANVEYGLANGGKFEMYATEFPAFAGALYLPQQFFDGSVADRMWELLARLLNKTDVLVALRQVKQ